MSLMIEVEILWFIDEKNMGTSGLEDLFLLVIFIMFACSDNMSL